MFEGGGFKEFATKNATAIFAVAVVMTLIVIIFIILRLMKKLNLFVSAESIGCEAGTGTGTTDLPKVYNCPA